MSNHTTMCSGATIALVAGAFLLGSPSEANAASRTVFAEDFTATWCTYCPSVGRALRDLDADYDELIAYQCHGADSYTYAFGNARLSFYGVTGYPSVWLDGTKSQVGSYSSDAANYSNLRTLMNQCLSVSSDTTISVSGAATADNAYKISADVAIEGGGSGKTMKIYFMQVLDDYPAGGSHYFNCLIQGSTEVVSLAAGELQTVEHTFTLSGASLAAKDETTYFVWAQQNASSGPAQVYNSINHDWGYEPSTYTVGFGGDFSTIQAAIDGVNSGDIVEIAAGTYNERINFNGKNVHLIGVDGPEATILDAQETGTAVIAMNDETTACIIEGLTITNGSAVTGGGFRCTGQPTVTNCIISNCTASLGPAMFNSVGNSGPTVSDTAFCGNRKSDGTVDHIWGNWTDGGDVTFDDTCPDDPGCEGDFNGDGTVGVPDLLSILDAWGPCSGCDQDLNGDGTVGVPDLLSVLDAWGDC